MTESSITPTIYLIAGPNGAGKTSFATSFLPKFSDCREFLNADLIAAGLSPFLPETQSIQASKLLLLRIDELVQHRTSFSVETTLSAKSYRLHINHWQKLGFRVILYFLWLPSADFAVSRVAERVREGGHNIPEDVIRRRYKRGLENLFELYIPIVRNVRVYNGAVFPPALLWKVDDVVEEVLDYNTWKLMRERK